MTDVPSTLQPVRRLDLNRLFDFFLHPRNEFNRQAAEGQPFWLTPLLALTLSLLARLALNGFLQARAAALGQVNLPPDWQWWTPDMQNQYMQAQALTQGPVFVYVIPMVLGVSALWLGWLILSALLHLVSTLLGGRGAMSGALNTVAWASLPFIVRDIVRVVYMVTTRTIISSAGLSGFVLASDTGTIFLSELLRNVDIFLVWSAILLVIGFQIKDNISTTKAVTVVVSVLAVSLVVQAGLGLLSSKLGGLMITRPFF
jgi:hypothetical protein